MQHNTSTLNQSRNRTLFLDVMKMNCEDRKAFIEKNSPNMPNWQKRQTLN